MNEASIRLHVEPLDASPSHLPPASGVTQRSQEGGFVATSPDVPGLVAEGRSITEAVEIAQGLVRKIAESCIDHGDPLPPALATLSEEDVAVDLLVPVSVP